MKKEILSVLNRMSDDDSANSAYVIKYDNSTKLLLMTSTGIMIIDLKSEYDITSATNSDLDNMSDIEYGFAISMKGTNNTEYVYINEDGVVEKDTSSSVIVTDVEFAGNMEELSELVEDEAVPYDIYEWLDDWGVMIG